ncbi:MAG TPA: hypothetical protein VMA13_06610, partial [Candidatus Saccharimonadales bacterium]|nr:hypothetical protein [Candidatus Saccharimonadales bacterium]
MLHDIPVAVFILKHNGSGGFMTGPLSLFRWASFWCLLWLYCIASGFRALALPQGGTVVQGGSSVSITSSGSQMNINQNIT